MDHVQKILTDKHGIGEHTQIETRCHLCGFPIEECKKPVAYDFNMGFHVQFCDQVELNSWKSQYKIN